MVNDPTANAGDVGSVPGLERSPGGGHGNPLQYSCLENPHGQSNLAAVHGIRRVGHDLATKPPRFKCKPRFIMYRVFYIYNRIFFTVADFTVLLLHF